MEPGGVEITFDLKTPKTEHYHAIITNLSSLDCIQWVRTKLTKTQLEMFRKTCLGFLLDMQELTFPSQLVHNILLREVVTTGVSNQMWFCVQGRRIRFSAYEFGLVTGLKFGKTPVLPETFVCRLRDTYFKGKNLQLRHFYEQLRQLDCSSMPDQDVVNLALYYVLERFLLARDRRRLISVKWMNFVDDLDAFNDYPWGTESFHATLKSMKGALHNRLDLYKQRMIAKKGKHQGEKYSLEGCPYAIQVWLYEAVPFIGTAYGEILKDFKDRIPRILRWRTMRVPTEEELINDVFMIRRIDRPLVLLEPTATELATEWHSILVRYEGMERGEHVVRALQEILPLAENEVLEHPQTKKKKKKDTVSKKAKHQKKVSAQSIDLAQDTPESAQDAPYISESVDDASHLDSPPHTTITDRQDTFEGHSSAYDNFMCTVLRELTTVRNEVIGLRNDSKAMQYEIDGLKKAVIDLTARMDPQKQDARPDDADYLHDGVEASPSHLQEPQCHTSLTEVHAEHLDDSEKHSVQFVQDPDEGDRKPSYPVHEVLMQPSAGQFLTKDAMSYSNGCKRMKTSKNAENYSCTSSSRNIKIEREQQEKKVSQNIIKHSDPFGISDLQNLDSDRFGSVAKDIKDLMDRKVQTWGPLFTNNPSLLKMFVDAEEKLSKQDSKLANQEACHYVIDMEDACVTVDVPVALPSVDEDEGEKRPSYPVNEVLMQPPVGQFLTVGTMVSFSCK